jgi:hypothetical protein
MTPYVPPEIIPVTVETEVNVFRPDGRDRVFLNSEYLGEGFTVGITQGFYVNPSVSTTELNVEFQVSPKGTVDIGATLVEGEIVPSIAIKSVLLDEGENKLVLQVSRELIKDPRALEELIQSNVVGVNLSSNGTTASGKVNFNSDGVEVYEGRISIPLTESGFATLNSYVRFASESSDYYWSPKSYQSVGVALGLPVEMGDFKGVVGVQPGIILDSGELAVGAPVGTQFTYEGDNFTATGNIGYGYGIVGRVDLKWKF